MKQRLISIPFFLLRTTTAGAALVTGLLQTYVFAHILSPQRFSDLHPGRGLRLFALADRLRHRQNPVRAAARALPRGRAQRRRSPATPPRVVLFYFALVADRRPALLRLHGDAHVRFARAKRPSSALFFLFVALNLVWFALRNISIAVDEYVLFEALETVRRAGYFIGLAAVLVRLAAHRHADRAQRAVGRGGDGLRQAHDRARRLAAAHRRLRCRLASRSSAPTRPSSCAAAPMRRAKSMSAITPI